MWETPANLLAPVFIVFIFLQPPNVCFPALVLFFSAVSRFPQGIARIRSQTESPEPQSKTPASPLPWRAETSSPPPEESQPVNVTPPWGIIEGGGQGFKRVFWMVSHSLSPPSAYDDGRGFLISSNSTWITTSSTTLRQPSRLSPSFRQPSRPHWRHHRYSSKPSYDLSGRR